MRQRREALLYGHLALSFLAMGSALLLMYRLEEGSKHLLTFSAVALVAISRMDTRFFKKAMFGGAVLAYLFLAQGRDPYAYQVPFWQEEREAELAHWQEAFSRELALEPGAHPSFGNVIIWTFSDQRADGGGSELMQWQLLYALPEGFGISCCMREYVLENRQQLQSRYISLPAGGELDALYAREGARLVGRSSHMAVYDMGSP